MRGKKTDKKLAAIVSALSEMGKTQEEISTTVGLPQTTISDVIAGKGKWANIQREAWFDTYRKSQKRKLQAASLDLAEKTLAMYEQKMDRASASQLAVSYGIFRDKERLDSNESTENVSVHVKVESDTLNKTLDRLLKGLRD